MLVCITHVSAQWFSFLQVASWWHFLVTALPLSLYLECWMKWLLSFLFFTIMTVSCSFPFNFVKFSSMPSICLICIPVLFFFFHGCTEPWIVFYLLDFHSWCIYKALEYAFLNPIYVFPISLYIIMKIFVIWAASSERLFPRDSLCSLFLMSTQQVVS